VQTRLRPARIHQFDPGCGGPLPVRGIRASRTGWLHHLTCSHAELGHPAQSVSGRGRWHTETYAITEPRKARAGLRPEVVLHQHALGHRDELLLRQPRLGDHLPQRRQPCSRLGSLIELQGQSRRRRRCCERKSQKV
jgi:hypothetical protein